MRRVAGGENAFAWGLLALLAVGCGNSSSSGPMGAGGAPAMAGASSGGAGASNLAGGANAGAAGSAGATGGAGGGLTLGDSPTEACIAYVLAVCGRQAECAGSSRSNCLSVSLSCPDLVFSAGSNRTVADLQTCASTYATMSCDQIRAGVLPACVTPGSVPLGQPCAFSSQCASLSCGGEQTCGQCVPSAHEGEECSPTAGLCLGTLVCNDGKCESVGASAGPNKALGEACVSTSDCAPSLRCDQTTKACANYPTLGMSCADTRTCVNDSYCELDGLTCKAYPTLGMACGVDGFTGTAGYCATGLRCSFSSKSVGTCIEPRQVGQPCLNNPDTGMPDAYGCEDGTRCDEAQVPALCAPLIVKGQACGLGLPCADGLKCLCPDGSATCEQHICGELRLNAQSCSSPGDICHPGFSCSAGSCQPRESQGLFAAACGP